LQKSNLSFEKKNAYISILVVYKNYQLKMKDFINKINNKKSFDKAFKQA